MTTTIGSWGKDIQLLIDFDVYDGEILLREQNDAFERFIKTPNVLEQCTDAVLRYFCGSYEEKKEILELITPKIMHIRRTINIRTVVILCDTDSDYEHGIALLYENERFVSILNQEDIL